MNVGEQETIPVNTPIKTRYTKKSPLDDLSRIGYTDEELTEKSKRLMV